MEKRVHGERITIEQQATDNKSDAVEESVARLDNKGRWYLFQTTYNNIK